MVHVLVAVGVTRCVHLSNSPKGSLEIYSSGVNLWAESSRWMMTCKAEMKQDGNALIAGEFQWRYCTVWPVSVYVYNFPNQIAYKLRFLQVCELSRAYMTCHFPWKGL